MDLAQMLICVTLLLAQQCPQLQLQLQCKNVALSITIVAMQCSTEEE